MVNPMFELWLSWYSQNAKVMRVPKPYECGVDFVADKVRWKMTPLVNDSFAEIMKRRMMRGTTL